MRRTTATGIAIALAALASLAATAAAQPDGAEAGRGPLEPAWRHATAMAARSLGPDDAGRLTLLAYAAAVGRTCEGLALDRDRYRAAFRVLAEERKAQMLDAKKMRSQLRRVSYHLGVATGLFLAESALDSERFCTGARESIAADPEIAALFTR